MLPPLVYLGIELVADRDMQVMCAGAPFPPNLWPLGLCVSIVMSARQSEPQAAASLAAGVPWPAYDAVALLTGGCPAAAPSHGASIT